MGTRRRDEGPDHRVFLASAVCGDLSENCWLLSLQLNGWYSGERAHSLPDSAHGAAFLRGGWLPGTRLPCHNSPLLPSAGAQSCGPAGRPGVALRPGGGPGEPAGCELVRVLPDCVAESAGPVWVWRLAGGWHADTAEPRWRGPRLAPHPRVILLGPGWGGGKADPPGHTLGPQRELGNMRGPRYSGRSCYRRLLWSWS